MTKNHDPTTSCSICLSSWRRNRQKKKNNPNWFGHLSGSLTFMVTIVNLHPKQILPGKHNRKKWSKYKQQGRNFPSFSKIKEKRSGWVFPQSYSVFPLCLPKPDAKDIKTSMFSCSIYPCIFFFFLFADASTHKPWHLLPFHFLTETLSCNFAP